MDIHGSAINPPCPQADGRYTRGWFWLWFRVIAEVLLWCVTYKDHLSLKPHGNESPQSSALVFLSDIGTTGGPHPLQQVPGPHKVKSIWNRKLKWVCLVSLPKLILPGFCNFCWWQSLMWLWEGSGVVVCGALVMYDELRFHKGEAGRQWCFYCPGPPCHVWTHLCSWVCGCSQGKGKKLLIRNRKPIPLSFPSLTTHKWSSLSSRFPDSGNFERQRCFSRQFREGKKLQKSLKYYLLPAKKLLFLPLP